MPLQSDSLIAEVEIWRRWLPVAHLYMCATGRLCTLRDNPLSAQASWPCKVGWQQVSRNEAILMMFGWSMALVQIKKGYSWQNCSLTYCLSTMQSLLGLSFYQKRLQLIVHWPRWPHSTHKSPARHQTLLCAHWEGESDITSHHSDKWSHNECIQFSTEPNPS